MFKWKITKDRISEKGEKNYKGYSRGTGETNENPLTFSLYDDDGICYAEGILWATEDDYQMEESLSDPLRWAMRMWGCTDIKINGESIFG
tara:strand:- start:2442 stop:2711 length:270 start_codon:yes stop_codon:yes gene_type:complete